MSDQPESDKFDLAPELAALQNRLAQLTPTALRNDRDQLMFDAGRAAERAGQDGAAESSGQDGRAIYIAGPSWAGRNLRATGSASARFWPAAAATMTAATVLLAATLVWQNQPQPIAQPSATPPATVSTTPNNSALDPIDTRPRRPRATAGYLAIRDAALTRGLGALAIEFDSSPTTTGPPTAPVTARQLLEELLPDTSRQRG
jgi:hypothetical protein